MLVVHSSAFPQFEAIGHYFFPFKLGNGISSIGRKDENSSVFFLQVSWVRHRDVHILTAGEQTFTSDQRLADQHMHQVLHLYMPLNLQLHLLLPCPASSSHFTTVKQHHLLITPTDVPLQLLNEYFNRFFAKHNSDDEWVLVIKYIQVIFQLKPKKPVYIAQLHSSIVCANIYHLFSAKKNSKKCFAINRLNFSKINY